MAWHEKRQDILATVEDGRLTIPGSDDAYIQGAIRTFWLEVTNLELLKGVGGYGEGLSSILVLSGEGAVGRSDTIEALGWGDLTKSLPTSIRALPELDTGGSRIVVGFSPPYEQHDGYWFAEVKVDPVLFAKLVADWEIGAAKVVGIGGKPELWINADDWHATEHDFLRWYLVPSTTRASSSPEMEAGPLIHLTWKDERHKASVPAADPAPTADDKQEPLPSPAPQKDYGNELVRLRKTIAFGLGAIAMLLLLLLFK